VITREGDWLRVSGALTMNTVAGLLKEGLQAAEKPSLFVDLAQVGAVDSAAVSLMLAWVREAARSQTKLSFCHIPSNLLSLARLYGVANSLPLAQDVSVQSALLKTYTPHDHA
jgi:phospholipid transport system transporter-binding protein